MTSLDTDFPEWISSRSSSVLEHARAEIARRATSAKQQELLERALHASGCARFLRRYHASMHLPLLVHAAVTGDDAPALPLAAACTLLWAGAELYDNLTDGDLTAPWQQSAPFEIIFTATAIGAVLPQAIIAGLSVPWERREGMLSDLGAGLLGMFHGQARDLALAGVGEPEPAEVEASVVGKNGVPKSLFAGLAARMAGAEPEARVAYMKFARALGVIYQLQSDHFEMFFDERCRDLDQGTRTLHIALCIQGLSGAEREGFLALLERARTEPDAQAAVRARLRQADVLRPWIGVLRRHVEEAEDALDAAGPMEPAGRILRRLVRERSPRCA